MGYLILFIHDFICYINIIVFVYFAINYWIVLLMMLVMRDQTHIYHEIVLPEIEQDSTYFQKQAEL